MSYGHTKRVWTNRVMLSFTFLATVSAIVPLFLILYHLLAKGITSLNWHFLTELPKPVGEEGGGMANAIVGTYLLISLAAAIGIPIGFMGGLYLAEYGKGNKTSRFLREMADLLNGTPSIVIGMFIYTVVVIPMGHFSALAGGIALGIMMVPIVMRTTEEMLKLVPRHLREAGLALGIPYWRVLISIVLKTARGGIVTGTLLAIARIAGETAPLLFTALGNQFWSTNLTQPIAALPLQIFVFAISPFDEWQAQAWAGALLLILIILVLNIGARLFFRNPFQKRKPK